MARAGIAPNQKFTLGGAKFIIHTRLEDDRWQVRNVLTGEWNAFAESDLLRLYQDRDLIFEVAALDEVKLHKDSIFCLSVLSRPSRKA